MTAASIIIATHNQIDLLQRCIASLRLYTDVPHEIIVVDKSSTDGTAAWCMRENLTLISLPSSEDYPTTCNKGLRLSSGDTLVLLGSEAVVMPNWLSNMRAALLSAPDVGIVGPVTNEADGSDSQQAHFPFKDLAEFQRIAAEANFPDRLKWKRVDRIASFCFVFNRCVMEKIGLLDDRPRPEHDETDEYCTRARLHGYHILACRDTLIYRDSAASTYATTYKEEFR